MADIFTKTKRSEIMSRVHSSGNRSTELRLIKVFNELGITGWRRHYNVKGHPDFVFLEKRIAIFVDGCFWHGHDCRNTRPKNNHDYWEEKRQKNIAHDENITELFINRGWTVIRIWECELQKKNYNILICKISELISKQ